MTGHPVDPTPTHHTKCPGADFSGANLSSEDLSYADLVGANLTQTTLAECSFITLPPTCTATNLTSARLIGATIQGTATACVFYERMPGITYPDCAGADMSGSDLRRASISGDFSDVSFQ